MLNVIPGYSHIYDIRESRNGGGVSIYVVDCINYKKRLDLKLDKSYFESYFIEIDKNVFKLKSNVIIGALYKPPNVSIDIFNSNIETILKLIQKEKKYAYLIGDYNINTLNETNVVSHEISEFVTLMSSYSYHKLINVPTRVIKTSSSLLDNMYSNVPSVYMKLEKVVHYVQYAPPIISLYLQLEHQQNLLRDPSISKKETCQLKI